MGNSMTGYGRAQAVSDGREIAVELRSVNHRYFEFSARLPRGMGYLEDRLKKQVAARVSRGKVELTLTCSAARSGVQVQADEALAAAYVHTLRALSETLHLQDDLTASVLLRLPDVLTVSKLQEEEDAVWNLVAPVAKQALDGFCAMRAQEGERLSADIDARLDALAAAVVFVQQRSPASVEAYRGRLYEKLTELLADTNIDEQRLLTEAAIFADKIAVDEETVRLDSHLAQYRQLLHGGEPAGRKLDFLTQELNREVNTIGSKAQDLEIANQVLQMKAEIEKIREQIQNIE